MALDLTEVLVHDPQAKLDYGLEIEMAEGDALATATWVSNPASPAIIAADPAPSTDGNNAILWIEPQAGASGKYKLTCHFTTTAGRADDRTVAIRIKDR